MVNAVVREWLRQVLGDEAAKSGYGEKVRNFLALFYVDDDYIASRDKGQLQGALDILISLFERAGLVKNVTKTKQMTCIPGRIRTKILMTHTIRDVQASR